MQACAEHIFMENFHHLMGSWLSVGEHPESFLFCFFLLCIPNIKCRADDFVEERESDQVLHICLWKKYVDLSF